MRVAAAPKPSIISSASAGAEAPAASLVWVDVFKKDTEI